MIQKIQGEQPFQVLSDSFSISPSNEGYSLQISADGENYSTLFSVGADVTRLVTNVANGSYYRLLGNDSEVSINWRTTCKGSGSGGGGSDVTVTPTLTAGTQIASISVDGTPTTIYAPEAEDGVKRVVYNTVEINDMTTAEVIETYNEMRQNYEDGNLVYVEALTGTTGNVQLPLVEITNNALFFSALKYGATNNQKFDFNIFSSGNHTPLSIDGRLSATKIVDYATTTRQGLVQIGSGITGNGGTISVVAPTSRGTAGQVLVSGGANALPTWTDMIKAVQITDAAYAALATKDPNTLYLIVD